MKVNTEGEECAIVLGTPPERRPWTRVGELFVEVHEWTQVRPAPSSQAHLRTGRIPREIPTHDGGGARGCDARKLLESVDVALPVERRLEVVLALGCRVAQLGSRRPSTPFRTRRSAARPPETTRTKFSPSSGARTPGRTACVRHGETEAFVRAIACKGTVDPPRVAVLAPGERPTRATRVSRCIDLKGRGSIATSVGGDRNGAARRSPTYGPRTRTSGQRAATRRAETRSPVREPLRPRHVSMPAAVRPRRPDPVSTSTRRRARPRWPHPRVRARVRRGRPPRKRS